MDGGEKIPMGAQHIRGNELVLWKSPIPSSNTVKPTHTEARKLQKQNKASKRLLKWANNPEKCKREFAVKNLYPRILHAFSDIVVFVLRNDRSVFLLRYSRFLR